MYKKNINGVYTLLKPEQAIPVIFDSPHSGKITPNDFDYACSEDDYQQSIEHFVDELYEPTALNIGATFLKAEFPRSYIDPNRSENDIDNDLLEDKWAYPTDPKGRSCVGIGLVRRLIKPNINLYNRKLSHEEINQRIEKYYRLYHQVLAENIERLHKQFGKCLHINCHSMPSTLTAASGLPISNSQPDFVLSNRDDTTSSPEIIYALKDILKAQGFKVTINTPYKGAEIIKRTGNPHDNIHAIQIETNRSLFMNERSCKKSKLFEKLNKKIKTAFSQLKSIN